jgi:HK97 family phage portal protein
MNNTSGWKRVASALGLIAPTDSPSDVRAELPILSSPNVPINAVNLTGTSEAISTDRAIGLAGVYRAVSIISTAVSQLELGVWRNGEELPLKSTDLIVRPDIDLSLPAFLEQTTNSLAINGNAYWLLNKSGPTADVKNISVMNPLNTFIEHEDGKTYFREGTKRFPEWRVKHLMLTRLPGYELGVGPIQACQNELRGAIDLRNYADQWFTEAAIPNGILKTDQTLTPELADAYRTRWNETAQGGRGIQVLGSGLTYTPIYLSPADAQFLESQAFSQTQIARMFGVPAIYMMTDPGNSSTYSNQEQVDSAFIRYTLQKYFTEVETAFSDLLPRGQNARFKTDGLLRADFKTRSDVYSAAITAGWLTVDEVRQREGLQPINANPNQDGTTTDGNN